MSKTYALALICLALGVLTAPAIAQNAPGVTDTEIKIGQTMPYTGPTDYYPIEDMQMMRFNGKQWVRFGDLLSGSL